MSAQTKSRAKKLGKAMGIALFAFLMFFNIKFAASDDTNGDIDLFGLKVSVFTNSSYATGFPKGCEDICRWVPDVTCTYIVGTGFCDGYWKQ